MHFLCLGGPENGRYLTRTEAKRLGYRNPTLSESVAWDWEAVQVWPT